MINSRSGFTMIELIFIIVIIGILFAIALPKLAATRDDAALAVDVSNMSQCIMDAAGRYTATKTDLSDGDSTACNRVKCYNITYSSGGKNFIVTTKLGPPNYCSYVNMIGGHLAKTYTFKGTQVSF